MSSIYQIRFDFHDTGKVEVVEGGLLSETNPQFIAAISFALRSMADVLQAQGKKLELG